MTMDVSDDKQVQSVFKSLKARSILPTMVVNSAGIAKSAYLIDENLENFKRMIDVNLGGTFSVAQSACKVLIEAKSFGSIVAVSSLAATKALPGFCSYAASKAGVVALTSTLAAEMAKYNIRCNAVLPGTTDTPILHTASLTEEVVQMSAAIPMQRIAQPEEIAELIVFLASDKSSFMTGGAIPISGGWH